MRLASWVLGVPLAVAAVAVAVANRGPVVLSFDPLPWSVQLPLFAVLFLGMLIGLAIGIAAEWWLARRWRREARRQRRLAAELKRQVARSPVAAADGSASLPAVSDSRP